MMRACASLASLTTSAVVLPSYLSPASSMPTSNHRRSGQRDSSKQWSVPCLRHARVPVVCGPI